MGVDSIGVNSSGISTFDVIHTDHRPDSSTVGIDQWFSGSGPRGKRLGGDTLLRAGPVQVSRCFGGAGPCGSTRILLPSG